MAYLNLGIEVTALPDNRYRITMQSPVGEAAAEAAAPFTAQELADFRAIFRRERDGVTRAQEAQAARSFGTRLFDFLIRKQQDLNAAYFASLERAGANGLRLRLSVEKAGSLADVPWEFLRDPNRDFLALSRQTPLVRYTPQLSVRPPAPLTPPLRVLVMIASPQGYAALDADGEWARLNAATAELQKKGALTLERMDDATLIALQRRLRAKDYHVFHYIGHSVFDALAGQGLLVFETDGSPQRAQLVSAGSLSRELGEESTIRLVVLNSCESAQDTPEDVFGGIASALVARGIPAVVAMQQEITDLAAQAFAEEFYRSIADRLPIDAAVSEGRRAIANRVQNIEWATPVLFMRAEDGILFHERADPTRRIQPVSAPTGGAASGDTIRSRSPSTPDKPSKRPWLAWAAAGLAILAIIGVSAVLLRPQPPPVTPTPTPTPIPAELPDLSVTTSRVIPQRPKPGQIFRLSIGIENIGLVDSGAFEYSWDASSRLLAAATGQIANVAPGASRNFVITFLYGWWGTYDSVINVDDTGDVREIDDRVNNRRTVTITVDPLAPFEIDFSLLPTLEASTPGDLLLSDMLVPWNMAIGVSGRERSDCAATPIRFAQAADGDMTITPEATGVTADCLFQPLAVELAQPAGNARAAIVPAANGQGTMVLYGDRAGNQELFRFTANMTAGVPVTLGAEVGAGVRIRRVELFADGQPITLTTLVLLPIT
jgi:CHAT domain-containing protein